MLLQYQISSSSILDYLQWLSILRIEDLLNVPTIISFQINVDTCLKDLQAIKDEVPLSTPFQQQLLDDLKGASFKGHDVKKSKYSFKSSKTKFIDNVMSNINKRYLLV